MLQDAQFECSSVISRWTARYGATVVESGKKKTKKGSLLRFLLFRDLGNVVGVIVVFVTQNLVSKRTVSLATCFTQRETDEVHIVTSVVGDQHIADAEAFLETFQAAPLPRSCIIRCVVLTRGQGRVSQSSSTRLRCTGR